MPPEQLRIVVTKAQAFVRGALTRKRLSVALMFKTHAIGTFNLSEVCDACMTNSRAVAKVESKIGDLSLRNALKEFLEDSRHPVRGKLEFRIRFTV